MIKKFYRFMGKPAGIAALGLALVTFSCQENAESPLMDSQDQVMRYQNGDIIPGSYIVVLKPQSLGFRKDGSYQDNQASMRKSASGILAKYRISDQNIGAVYAAALDGFAVKLDESELELLKNDPAVSYIEPDRVMTIAQKGKPGGGGGSTAQETPWGITRVGGAVNYTGTNAAWVIDTGIDLTHPDLNVRAVDGFTAFTSGRDANLNDGDGHGTHVAGTIAAINNSIGVVGVAAGAPVVPVKVLDSRGSGSYTGVIAGVDWVAAKGKTGDVANMSLGGPVSQALDDAIVAAAGKGIKFVIAAGNSAANANNYSPARVNGANIFTISASDINNRFATFSNFGNPPIDYCAPGVSIKSTWIGGGYNTISGTSMAAPHAAGVLLLGAARTSGFVTGDKDSTADPIISR
ncbi:S8 family serine peptidase [Cognataquiflexum rubidum]|uniref:S8 family serine peptidase n=1 Tax=Cognataquiflexum rubidum TaxID=2922273 RepID=UPI001F12DADA|nr:S8 family serine peptidase [Cognataquiflexum rubidum]MCH6233495.1 S8 family serine peptidase [Cognataquiflexum rubidum]